MAIYQIECGMEMINKISDRVLIILLFVAIAVIMTNAFYFDCLLDFKDTRFPALCTEIIPLEIGESIREWILQ